MDASEFTEYRPLMFSIAYRMTGSVSDAEDIVQEAFLRLARASQASSPKAYLATITTRLAIDHLLAETSDSLSMAFLILLESLAPAERAVFLLREVFGYGYPELAEITGKSEPACRQIFARAQQRIRQGRDGEGRPRFETSRAEGAEITGLFLAAAAGGDMTSLLERLAPDVLFYGDSGGLGETTFIAPVYGREKVAEVIGAQFTRTARLDVSLRAVWVNAQPGLVATDADGGLIAVIAFDVLDGQVQAIAAVANPAKLRHLGPISHSWHLRWRADDYENRSVTPRPAAAS